jgi:Cysteine-rich CPCC
MKKSFWERRRFFEVYSPVPNAQAGNEQSNEAQYACPCCGYPTLGSLSEFEICYLCGWEDDGQDDAGADVVRSGPNHSFSLVEARENFERYLVKYPPELDTRAGGHDSEREKEAKRVIIEAYDKMMEGPRSEELLRLQQQVAEGKQILRQELKRRISGPLYEGTPCPYCGGMLRTRLAKQCRHCGRDWHDPDQVTDLRPIKS